MDLKLRPVRTLTGEQAKALHEECALILKYTVMDNRFSLIRNIDRLGSMMVTARILGFPDAWDLIQSYKDKLDAALDALNQQEQP